MEMFATLEEAEAIAQERCSQSRDKAVRLLQYEVREGGEAGERVDRSEVLIANCDGSFILQEGSEDGS